MGTTAEILDALKRAIPNLSVRDERWANGVIEKVGSGERFTPAEWDRVYRLLGRASRRVTLTNYGKFGPLY
jgi:hypothetical protein